MKCWEEQLHWCLVGWFGEVSNLSLEVVSLNSFMTNIWS